MKNEISEKSNECAAAGGARTASVLHYSTPVVDMHHQQGEYLLEVELPGVTKSGVDLQVEDGKLTITAHRSRQPGEGKVLHSEIPASDFRRVFDLDPTIDVGSIRAELRDGLLTIRLERAESHQPKKISVA